MPVPKELHPLSIEVARNIIDFQDEFFEDQKDLANDNNDFKVEITNRYAENIIKLSQKLCPELTPHFQLYFGTKNFNSFGIYELGIFDEEKIIAECSTSYSTLKTDIKSISFALSVMAWNRITWDLYAEYDEDTSKFPPKTEKVFRFSSYMYHYLSVYTDFHYDEYLKDRQNYILDIDSISRICD